MNFIKYLKLIERNLATQACMFWETYKQHKEGCVKVEQKHSMKDAAWFRTFND